MPTPPDWLAIARPPAGGTASWKVALSRVAGSLQSSPRQFGPTIRRSWLRAVWVSWRCSRAPSAPSSPKPDETTTAARTPAAAASRSTPFTSAAGTHTTTRSTGSVTAARLGNASTPSREVSRGCTATTVPVKPPALMARSTVAPIPVPSERTPTTATDRGCSIGSSERVSAPKSRPSALAAVPSVGAVSSERTTVLRSQLLVDGKPESAKTLSIAWFSASTSASSSVMPSDTARAARCSSRSVPTPRPCTSSATRKATSPRPGPIRSTVPRPTSRPRCSATRDSESGSASTCSTY